MTDQQEAYISLFEQDVREHPDAYKANVRENPRDWAARVIGGLDERGVRDSIKSLRNERRSVHRAERRSVHRLFRHGVFRQGDA